MDILTQVLKRIKLGKCQAKFIEQLVGLILAIPGRINYLNLERYGERSEKSYRNWFKKPLAWVAVNAEVVIEMQAQGVMGKTLVMIVDGSFIKKAGKHTPGLGKFWESKAGKAMKGLELQSVALVDLEKRQAVALEAQQTLTKPEEVSRMTGTGYAKHSLKVVAALPASLRQRLLRCCRRCALCESWLYRCLTE